MAHSQRNTPLVFNIFREEALEVRHSPYGTVGKLFSGSGVEAVWISKQHEAVDPDWYSQPTVDLILVIKGHLKIDFESTEVSSCVLEPGDFLVLPPNTRCRAYRWPRDSGEAAVFLAVYPTQGGIPQKT